MSFFKRSSEQREATETRRQHNSRFNNKNTDPDSAEYLASHDEYIAKEKAAKKSRRW